MRDRLMQLSPHGFPVVHTLQHPPPSPPPPLLIPLPVNEIEILIAPELRYKESVPVLVPIVVGQNRTVIV